METKYKIWFDTANIYLKSIHGKVAYLPLKDYKPLMNASNEERNQYEFLPFGIHWEKLDEDLCYDGFIPIPDWSAIDEGIADIKAGRITKIDNPKSLIAECLK